MNILLMTKLWTKMSHTVTVPSFEFLTEKVLKNYKKSILSYSTTKSFRSFSRSELENAATMCEILLQQLNLLVYIWMSVKDFLLAQSNLFVFRCALLLIS